MRLIDADFAQHIADKELSADDAGTVQWVLSHTPTFRQGPVIYAKWETDEFGCFCSACKEYAEEIEGEDAQLVPLRTPYCPQCGAKMIGREAR